MNPETKKSHKVDTLPNDQLSTRQLIMQTAEALFAEKGIDSVSLNEINKAADQKNTSSLHYHFGNKDGLVQAIVYKHYEQIEIALQIGLDRLEQQSSYSLRELVETVISPFCDQLDTDAGIYYLLIVAQLLTKSTDLLLVGHPQQQDKARLRAFAIFEGIQAKMPVEIRIARLVLFSSLLFHSLASFARFQRAEQYNPLGDKAFFKANLTDSLLALIGAPISEQTQQKLLDSKTQ